MKRLATVDGASGQIIDATISLEARGTSLLGAFVTIQSDSDEMLGRITETSLSNPVHDDQAFAPMIMKDGAIKHWSGEVDIEKAKVEVIAVLEITSGKRVPIRRNVPSGTPVMAADAAAIERFSNEDKHFLVLGHIPNSGGLPCSIGNRHNGPMTDKHGNDIGGYGEAHHTALLGQSGSAKTVLLTTMIAGRLAAHPNMGLLMPDTSGDLADPNRHSRGNFWWNYAEVLARAGIQIERISIDDIRLSSTRTLECKLKPLFTRRFNMKAPQNETLASYVVEHLFGDSEEVVIAELTGQNVIDAVIANIGRCYATPNTQREKQQRAIDVRDSQMASFNRNVEEIRRLFDGREELWQVVNGILNGGRKVVVEMSQKINDDDQRFVMREIMDQLSRCGRKIFYGGNMANALVVLDEAIRWVPEGKENDKEEIAEIIEAGFRETRKYGIGWMVVAQSPAGLSKRVLRECHTKMFGRNLGIGADRQHLEQMLSKQGAQAYDQLQIQGGYFWVGMSLNNNLGSGASYFALHPFGGNATEAFIAANPHIFQKP